MKEEDIIIGSTFTWTLKSPEESGYSTEEFKAFVDDHLNTVDENARVSGSVIYNDGEAAIIEVSEIDSCLNPFTLFYNEVKNRFPELNKENDDPYQRYFCMDVATLTSLFYYDVDSGCLADAEYDEEGAFDYYDVPDSETEMQPQWGGEALIEGVTLQLPQEEIKKLEKQDALIDNENHQRFNAKGEIISGGECSIHRAMTWFNTRDCAILTAWRQGKGRKTNEENNRMLQQKLRELGYGVTKITGWYPEKGKELARENSFLAVNLNEEENFQHEIYKLSECYEQDSFLYKKAGPDTPAIYVFTNDDCGKGKTQLLGRLRIGNMNAEAFSQIKSGRITFE